MPLGSLLARNEFAAPTLDVYHAIGLRFCGKHSCSDGFAMDKSPQNNQTSFFDGRPLLLSIDAMLRLLNLTKLIATLSQRDEAAGIHHGCHCDMQVA
jgi:hypothetical protein